MLRLRAQSVQGQSSCAVVAASFVADNEQRSLHSMLHALFCVCAFESAAVADAVQRLPSQQEQPRVNHATHGQEESARTQHSERRSGALLSPSPLPPASHADRVVWEERRSR